MASTQSTAKVGLIYGLAAYILWGIVPLYFKAIQQVPAREVLVHRIIWSALLLLVLIGAAGRFPALVNAFRTRRIIGRLILSTLMISANWYVFIYSVLTNQILQGSLGYFMLPIVNVAIGTIFFRESMRTSQWLALGFAVVGVVVLTLWLGQLPWIALTLAVSFSIYGIL
ncbi:MAG: EamA family transporter RarD, partial [Planctomycetes bacterium]|nr:EamA family transporter RarD [Planctomycetota bacterium]